MRKWILVLCIVSIIAAGAACNKPIVDKSGPPASTGEGGGDGGNGE